MKKDSVYLKVDSRNRLTLTKVSEDLAHFYRAYTEKGKIVLEPVKEVPKEEEWLFDPANKEIVDYLKECLTQEATIDFSSLKKKLKKK